jgi:SOS response regulatory protein OraA/RecX
VQREALAWCLAKLKASDQSEAQLRQGLLAKGFLEEDIEASLGWLKQRRLLDDSRTGARRVELVARRKGGLLLAEQELARLGIEGEAAQEALADWSPAEEKQRGRALLLARLKPGDGPPRAARLLASRGYEEEMIRDLIAEMFPDWEG